MNERLLLIDTCGDSAVVGVSHGEAVVGVRSLGQKGASAEIVSAVRELLAETRWSLHDLTAIGVVNGPGSFTGMRAGLAAAKGFCEALNLRLGAVSRLEVLVDAAALDRGFSVLDAGRGDLYVRQISPGDEPREFLSKASEFEAAFDREAGNALITGDTKCAEVLGDCGASLQMVGLGDALPAILRAIKAGGQDAALVDANYVRMEQDIYPRMVEPRRAVG